MKTEEKKLTWDVDMNKLRENGIFLATPMYGGACFGSYTSSILNLAVLCATHGIPFTTHYLYNESLIQRGRNYCADEFLRRTFKTSAEGPERHFQHLIFVDSDIEFTAQDIIILAHLQNTNPDYDIIGGTYPKKMIAWEKIKGAVDRGFADEDPEVLSQFVGDYVFSAVKAGQIRLDEPAEVAELGTGFMMIRRETFHKWKAAHPSYKYKPDHVRSKNFDGSRYIHAYFHCEIDKNERYLSEDYFFCHKAREAGMKVWLAPWMHLKHNGFYEFGGSLSALAAVGQHVTADETKIKKK